MIEPPDGPPAPEPGSAQPGAASPGYPPAQPPYPPGQPPFPPGPAGFPPGPAGFPPGPAGYPDYPYPAPVRGTDGFAVTSLVLGILGFFWITPVLAAVFGFIALSRIKRTGQGGRGLAIAGIVLAGVWITLLAGVIILGVTYGADRGSDGTVVGAGDVAATDLQVGDCIADIEETTMLISVNGVPCSQPHEGEVFAVFDLPAGPYPAQAQRDSQIESTCNDRLVGYAPSAVGDTSLGLFYVYPLERNWDAGDRESVCVAVTDPPATTSIRGR